MSDLKLFVTLATATIVFHVLASPVSAESPSAPSGANHGDELLIEAVVATVDDKPITLTELCNRLPSKRKLAMSEVAGDPEASKLLDAMILERLLEEEASQKRLSASEPEIEEYIREVAARNGLSRPEFEKALASEGRDFSSYKRQVKFDILKTKLSGSVARGGVSVSDAEIDQYLEEHPDFKTAGTSLRLRRILISATDRSPEDLRTRLALVMEDLKDDKNFGDIAAHYSDGPEGREGGSLGIIAEKDLSSEISDAVKGLQEGQSSKPIESEQGIQIFHLEQRIGKKEGEDESEVDPEDIEDALRAEIKKILQQQKTQERVATYFSSDLYKNHSIDKKV